MSSLCTEESITAAATLPYFTGSRKTRKLAPVGTVRFGTAGSRVVVGSPVSARGIVYDLAINDQRIDQSLSTGIWYFERRTVSIDPVDPDGCIGSDVALATFERS